MQTADSPNPGEAAPAKNGKPRSWLRRLLKLASWTTLAVAAALVGCGKKEEAPAAQAAASAAPATSAAPAKA